MCTFDYSIKNHDENIKKMFRFLVFKSSPPMLFAPQHDVQNGTSYIIMFSYELDCFRTKWIILFTLTMFMQIYTQSISWPAVYASDFIDTEKSRKMYFFPILFFSLQYQKYFSLNKKNSLRNAVENVIWESNYVLIRETIAINSLKTNTHVQKGPLSVC